jgi:hypothetical protein
VLPHFSIKLGGQEVLHQGKRCISSVSIGGTPNLDRLDGSEADSFVQGISQLQLRFCDSAAIPLDNKPAGADGRGGGSLCLFRRWDLGSRRSG